MKRVNTPNLHQASRLYYLKKEYPHKNKRISLRRPQTKQQESQIEVIPGESLLKEANFESKHAHELSIFEPDKRFLSFHHHEKRKSDSKKSLKDRNMLSMMRKVAGSSVHRVKY